MRSFSPPTWVITNWAPACLSKHSNARFAECERPNRLARLFPSKAIGSSETSRVWPSISSGDKFSADRPVCSIVGRRDADLSVIHRARRISKYRIIAREPILCSKSDRPREGDCLSHAALVPTVGRNSWKILALVIRVHADVCSYRCYGLTQLKYQCKKARPKNIQVSAPNAR